MVDSQDARSASARFRFPLPPVVGCGPLPGRHRVSGRGQREREGLRFREGVEQLVRGELDDDHACRILRARGCGGRATIHTTARMPAHLLRGAGARPRERDARGTSAAPNSPRAVARQDAGVQLARRLAPSRLAHHPHPRCSRRYARRLRRRPAAGSGHTVLQRRHAWREPDRLIAGTQDRALRGALRARAARAARSARTASPRPLIPSPLSASAASAASLAAQARSASLVALSARAS